MKKTALLILALLFLTPVLAQKKIFVATNGSDNNIGSIEEPLFSIAQAVILSKKLTSKKVDILLRKGVYYPDGSETQRVGIKINYTVNPTITGLMESRDEILEKAIEIIIEE